MNAARYWPELVRRRVWRQDANDRSHAQHFSQESGRAKRWRTNIAQVAQDFVRHRLRHQGHDGVVVLTPPELFVGFRQRAHQAGGGTPAEASPTTASRWYSNHRCRLGSVIGWRAGPASAIATTWPRAAARALWARSRRRSRWRHRQAAGSLYAPAGARDGTVARPWSRLLPTCVRISAARAGHREYGLARRGLRAASQVSCVSSDAAGYCLEAPTAAWDTVGRTG
jgi:hypothetical protein